MSKLRIKGKAIRLFFHMDLDGVISANLIQLFSGAKIVQSIPCSHSEYRGNLDKSNPEILNVFVDCRSTNRDEDIRIDHHAAGEDAAYLKRESIILDSGYKSAVSLVAHHLGCHVDKQILQEMDRADSGQPNVFSKFIFGDKTMYEILHSPGLHPDDYKNYEQFKDKLLGFMVKGFAIEDLKDTPEGYERKMEAKFKVVVEDIKKRNAPLIKLVHSPTHEGVFLKHVFKMTDAEFFGHILPYINQHYEVESAKEHLGIYVVVGFMARNFEFDEKCRKVIKNDHPEPFQIFVKRSAHNTSIDIGTLIQGVKEHTGINNGGGRDSVGGINTADKGKAVAALRFITDFIRKNAP